MSVDIRGGEETIGRHLKMIFFWPIVLQIVLDFSQASIVSQCIMPLLEGIFPLEINRTRFINKSLHIPYFCMFSWDHYTQSMSQWNIYYTW